jgi:hypothetical protein
LVKWLIAGEFLDIYDFFLKKALLQELYGTTKYTKFGH